MGCSTQRKYSPRIDQDFHEMFHIFVLKISDWSSQKCTSFTVLRPISSPINGNEASKLQYVSSYLVAGVNLYEAVGVTEVEDEDILKGITQNAIQLESALSNRTQNFRNKRELWPPDFGGNDVDFGILDTGPFFITTGNYNFIEIYLNNLDKNLNTWKFISSIGTLE
ncbi:hypothetical protein RhiirC2_793102 [Rhizophagus irregularis]|uniref:Uncharacterized protein n=1 Tax=Rhizophagus irregularis TaxID=588596 RepID=A0A2N1MG15_9GLOM|nr:hypothetical protein RhiirC2_793102 [Rhizophagus irregularis]